MENLQQSIQENKAAAFDWLVFAISFSLGFVFPTLRELVISPLFSYLMLAALLFYSTGAWLKHFPMYHRLLTTGNKDEGVPYKLFLILGHWLLILAAIIFAMAAVRKILDMRPATSEEFAGGWVALISTAGSTFITWLVFRGKTKLEKQKKVFPKHYLFRRELAGDVCLLIGVSIFSFIFWEKGIMAMLAARQNRSISDIWYMFIILAFSYMFFYLPLRYLFLVEDHFSNKTWKRMLLIFGLLLLKALFEMLNI